MAIEADYDLHGLPLKKSYMRIEHITGSKRAGWTAVIGVYHIKPQGDKNSEGNELDNEPLTTFNTWAPYDTGNPNSMALVYTKLKANTGGIDA